MRTLSQPKMQENSKLKLSKKKREPLPESNNKYDLSKGLFDATMKMTSFIFKVLLKPADLWNLQWV